MNNFYKILFEKSLESLIKLDFEDALDYLRAIDNYNEYDYQNVIKAVRMIDEIIPRKYYGENNPNNGVRAYQLEVGRESSPVLYFDFGFVDKKFLDEMLVNKDKIREIAEKIGKCDEFDYMVKKVDFGKLLKIRLWWD